LTIKFKTLGLHTRKNTLQVPVSFEEVHLCGGSREFSEKILIDYSTIYIYHSVAAKDKSKPRFTLRKDIKYSSFTNNWLLVTTPDIMESDSVVVKIVENSDTELVTYSIIRLRTVSTTKESRITI